MSWFHNAACTATSADFGTGDCHVHHPSCHSSGAFCASKRRSSSSAKILGSANHSVRIWSAIWPPSWSISKPCTTTLNVKHTANGKSNTSEHPRCFPAKVQPTLIWFFLPQQSLFWKERGTISIHFPSAFSWPSWRVSLRSVLSSHIPKWQVSWVFLSIWWRSRCDQLEAMQLNLEEICPKNP